VESPVSGFPTRFFVPFSFPDLDQLSRLLLRRDRLTNSPLGKALVAPCGADRRRVLHLRLSERCGGYNGIKLGKVAVQVSLAAMLVDADHAALEHGNTPSIVLEGMVSEPS
jgi:hypothetical protein